VHPSILADVPPADVEVIVLDGAHARIKGQPVLDESFQVDADLYCFSYPPS
jgi:hypothetical protein